MSKTLIYTDGACRGNPGPGGWAYVIIQNGVRTEKSGRENWTTNNQMELRAAIEALTTIEEPGDIVITTDSEYLVLGMTEWIHGWKEFFWTNSRGKPVMNQPLWEQLDRACMKHKVEWRWVRGHSGDAENERCDLLLANQQAGIPEGHVFVRRKRNQVSPQRALAQSRIEAGLKRADRIKEIMRREGISFANAEQLLEQAEASQAGDYVAEE